MRPYRDTPWDRPNLTIRCDFDIALGRRNPDGSGLACWKTSYFATVRDGPGIAGTPSGLRGLKPKVHRPDDPMEKMATVTLMGFDAHTIQFPYGHRVDLA